MFRTLRIGSCPESAPLPCVSAVQVLRPWESRLYTSNCSQIDPLEFGLRLCHIVGSCGSKVSDVGLSNSAGILWSPACKGLLWDFPVIVITQASSTSKFPSCLPIYSFSLALFLWRALTNIFAIGLMRKNQAFISLFSWTLFKDNQWWKLSPQKK